MRTGRLTILVLVIAIGGAAAFVFPSTARASETLLEQAMAGTHRSERNRARDVYRHPRETLLFFGLRADMTVVEAWPGGGWYTEILAPVLREKGRLFLAHYAIENSALVDSQRNARARFEAMLAERPEVYGKPTVTSLGAPQFVAIAPAGSADLVLTFRNVHNWSAARNDEAVFRAFFDALRPGGILGVVEHRAKDGTSLEEMIKSGYMTEQYVVGLAERAGFRFVAKSEINANPRDTKDHPNGVWTLPPTLRGVLFNRDRYLAIGESDRMTLKFAKP